MKQFFLGNGPGDVQDELSAVIHNLNVGVDATAPIVGGAQLFLSESTGTVFVEAYNQYCAKVSPVSLLNPWKTLRRVFSCSQTLLDFLAPSLDLRYCLSTGTAISGLCALTTLP